MEFTRLWRGPELEGSIAFLEFEVILGFSVLFLAVLMYLFYGKYSYNKDLD
jgi:hypothetical protein